MQKLVQAQAKAAPQEAAQLFFQQCWGRRFLEQGTFVCTQTQAALIFWCRITQANFASQSLVVVVAVVAVVSFLVALACMASLRVVVGVEQAVWRAVCLNWCPALTFRLWWAAAVMAEAQ